MEDGRSMDLHSSCQLCHPGAMEEHELTLLSTAPPFQGNGRRKEHELTRLPLPPPSWGDGGRKECELILLSPAPPSQGNGGKSSMNLHPSHWHHCPEAMEEDEILLLSMPLPSLPPPAPLSWGQYNLLNEVSGSMKLLLPLLPHLDELSLRGGVAKVEFQGDEDAPAGPGDNGERGEEAVAGLGEEGRKGDDTTAGSGKAEKGGDTDENSDSDHQKGFISYILDTDFVESLPVKVKYFALALKLQTRADNSESRFLREFHNIERKFAEMYQPLLEKRRQVASAIYEPREECEYNDEKMDDEEEMYGNEEGTVHEGNEDDDYEDYYYDYAMLMEEEGEEEDDDTEATGEENKEKDPKGISDFWLFKNVETLTYLIKKYYELILKPDIKVNDSGALLTFTLEFYFPNEYFKNELLAKTYVLKSRLAYDPHPYRGTVIEYSTGCEIDWNEGKNVTLKTTKRKQKHQIWGTTTMTKDFPKELFFNFFSPHGINLNGGDRNDDFLLGHNLLIIIPRSLLFFPGNSLESQQEGIVREELTSPSNATYDKIIFDNLVAAFEEAKSCCKNPEALEDTDR
ncbi:LOW QUALITY PROTEIN: nucleosome assembly protein 1-like 2 [Erethizon dorsatum]